MLKNNKEGLNIHILNNEILMRNFYTIKYEKNLKLNNRMMEIYNSSVFDGKIVKHKYCPFAFSKYNV